jgi:hypothetical protein
VTAAPRVGGPAPTGRVLRLALLGWGLGHLVLGRRGAGIAWLAAEAAGAALVAWLTVGLAGSSGYLLPFVAGCAFIAAWATQATLAYRGARAAQGAIGPAPVGSPAATIAWLSVPLLVWGTAFWLIGGQASTPAAVLDRFETRWPELVDGSTLPAAIAVDPAAVSAGARQALTTLQAQCPTENGETCDDPATLLRDLRITITEESGTSATAIAQLVRFERRSTTVLGFISGSEVVPVPQQTVLTLHLRASPATLPGGIDLGARRWQIASVEPGASAG